MMIVAEISANHNGSLERALRTIEVAAAAGADAVKLQTYTPDSITIDHDGPGFVIDSGLWAGRKLYDLYKEAATPYDWHEKLFKTAADCGIKCFSTPFDVQAVQFLEQFNPPFYKIASFEINDVWLIAAAARTGKPLIISTGTVRSDSAFEIADALALARNVTLLHCVSEYPAPVEKANLARIRNLSKIWNCRVGLSDHSLSVTLPAVAVAFGAEIIEKHFTLSRADGGPDAAFSLEPHEFKTMVENVHEAMLATVPYKHEQPYKHLARSLYAVSDIAAGEELNNSNIRSIRPGHGLPPRYLIDIIGHKAANDIKRGTPMKMEYVV